MGLVPNAGRDGTATASARLGAGTIRGAGVLTTGVLGPTAGAIERLSPRGKLFRAGNGRVATTDRASALSGGRLAAPLAATKLEAAGVTRSCPRTGSRRWTSTWAMRASWMGLRPKCSWLTATTALWTLTFRYTLMVLTLTTVVWLTTTLLTMRGPPQPLHDGRPT
jgi:hypothetical protein